MVLWNPLNAPQFLAGPSIEQHLRRALPCVVLNLLAIYLFTGENISIELKQDTRLLYRIYEPLLGTLGEHTAEP